MKYNLETLWDAAHEYSGRDPATGLFPCTPMTQALYAFQEELREIMDKVKPQRDLNEYNVYYFIKAILGEEP